MTRPIPVEIIRPNRTRSEWAVAILAHVCTMLIRAWIVMLLVPLVWRPLGYGTSLALCLVVSELLGARDSHESWTRKAVSR